MSKMVIDVNNISTYPSSFLEFCFAHKKTLLNTFPTENIQMDIDSDLFETIDKMFNDSYFECFHATRTYDINSIKNYGLIVPKNTKDLVDIILTPVESTLSKSLYKKVYEMMIEKSKNEDKYSTFHFVIGSLEDININNGFLMLDKYGGEILEDIFSIIGEKEYYDSIVSKIGVPKAVLFMLKKLLYESKEHFFRENCISTSIPKENIIDIFDVKLDGDYHE